ncbi:zinc-binding dehydrogenase [Frigoribacterium sp. UYMn621]|uniref:zinc-binding dehydrogenase n=1 Tax=Frigoribacterium sp. UYMn621 TaxID=3156343 RepID=UPI003390F055
MVKGFELLSGSHGELLDRDLPAPDRGQVVIAVRMSGVCASELYDWIQPPPQMVPVGHEPVGEVVAVGADVAFCIGDWVTGRVLRAFASHVVAEASDLALVPSKLRPNEVLGEPVGCVVEGLRRTRVGEGARIAVIGTGFMGLVMVQLLAHSLAGNVTAVDPRADARGAALDNGADAAHSPDEMGDATDKFDVVIEATGAQSGIDLSTRLVRPHGTLSILGYHRTPRVVDMQQWNYKALDVVNAHVRDRRLLRDAVAIGLNLAAQGRIDPGRLITHRFACDEIDEAFATLRDKPDGFIKAVIDYPME